MPPPARRPWGGLPQRAARTAESVVASSKGAFRPVASATQKMYYWRERYLAPEGTVLTRGPRVPNI